MATDWVFQCIDLFKLGTFIGESSTLPDEVIGINSIWGDCRGRVEDLSVRKWTEHLVSGAVKRTSGVAHITMCATLLVLGVGSKCFCPICGKSQACVS